MIDVVYNQKDCEVTIKGHAMSGECGHDTVCAAAAILAYTLAANVESAADMCDSENINLSEGEAVIKCTPKPEYSIAVKLMFQNICVGYELLSINFPENISYKIVGTGIENENVTNV